MPPLSVEDSNGGARQENLSPPPPPDIDIPPPPAILPNETEAAESLHKSINCGTDDSHRLEPIWVESPGVGNGHEISASSNSEPERRVAIHTDSQPSLQQVAVAASCTNQPSIRSENGLGDGHSVSTGVEDCQIARPSVVIDTNSHGNNVMEYRDKLPLAMASVASGDHHGHVSIQESPPIAATRRQDRHYTNNEKEKGSEGQRRQSLQPISVVVDRKSGGGMRDEKGRRKTFHATAATVSYDDDDTQQQLEGTTASVEAAEYGVASADVSPVMVAAQRQQQPRHWWEQPKQGKTMQFLSRTFQSTTVDDDNADVVAPVQRRQSTDAALAMSGTAPAAAVVEVTVRELEDEQSPSDRPTYRPRQGKQLYFTATR